MEFSWGFVEGIRDFVEGMRICKGVRNKAWMGLERRKFPARWEPFRGRTFQGIDGVVPFGARTKSLIPAFNGLGGKWEAT